MYYFSNHEQLNSGSYQENKTRNNSSGLLTGYAVKGSRRKVVQLLLFSSLLLSSFIFGAYFNVFAQSGENIQPSALVEVIGEAVDEDKQFVHIQQGDSIWKIASTYAPDHIDVRKYVRQIMVLNELKDHYIYAGQILVLP